MAWKATSAALRQYVSQSTYERFSPAIQRYYEPFKCAHCTSQPQPLTEQEAAAIFKAWRDGPLWLHMVRGTEAAIAARLATP